MAFSDEIQKLYISYFNRPADPGGLAYWINQGNQNGENTAAIANAFSASPEYKKTFAEEPARPSLIRSTKIYSVVPPRPMGCNTGARAWTTVLSTSATSSSLSLTAHRTATAWQ